MNIQDRHKLIKHMLRELETPNKTLTKWEESFIESVTDWFDKKGDVNERQFEILERIYTEKTA